MPESDKRHPLATSVRALLLLFSRFLVSVIKDLWRVGCAMCRPVSQIVVSNTVTGVRNLHNKKHWLRRSGTTFWGNAIGLCIAMISAQLVAQFIEVRGAGNLWGLFSKRTLVSENGYRLLSFIVEFLVTLTVFSAVEYFVDQRGQNRQTEVDQDDDY
ncbi:MAG: hypothetical protein QG652_275 [Pseudomonadota bacterium]|nr:hypothetical protein [Pseudomonadota bacterium]